MGPEAGKTGVSLVTLGCHGGSRPSEPADTFPDSSSRARMRSAGFAHPVGDNYGSDELLHCYPSILRHLSQLGVYLRVKGLHKFSCRYSSTRIQYRATLGYNPVVYSRIRIRLLPSIVAHD